MSLVSIHFGINNGPKSNAMQAYFAVESKVDRNNSHTNKRVELLHSKFVVIQKGMRGISNEGINERSSTYGP